MPELLRVGMKNSAAIADLVERLHNQGFYDGPLHNHSFTIKVEDAVIYFQQTHLGPSGLPLTVDGVVGPDTWWALRHPSGKHQRSYLRPHVPEGIAGERAAVLRVAIVEHEKNVREIPNGSNRSKEIDKYFPQWLQDKLQFSGTGPPWCCFSANWVFHSATGRWPCGKRTGSCATMVKWALQQGIYQPAHRYINRDAGSRILRPGDLFVILHPKNPDKPQTGHIGIVGAVNENQTRIGTYEGNCGNRYKAGLRDMHGITGIINPYVKSEDQVLNFDRTLPSLSLVAGNSTR